MTPLREAFVLPGLFLTVALLGGLRVTDSIHLVHPSLTAVVLGIVLVGALGRSGIFVPAAFMDAARRPVENVTGLVVLLAVFAASTQTIALLLPDRGLLHAAFAVFLFVQFLSLSAARIDRTGMLRSLFVLLGSFFVLRYIVLESLYDPDGGALKRVLTALMSGVTLGGIEYQPNAPVTGYVACATLGLFVTGLVLLPPAPAPPSTALTRTVTGLPVPLVILALSAAAVTACVDAGPNVAQSGPGGAAEQARQQRDALLAAARVWTAPRFPPAQVDLGTNPDGPGRFDEHEEVDCRLSLEEVGGLTSKFNCELPDGTVVKVKYGAANPELHAEVAATRLLTALGFAADRMYVVRGVTCRGCPFAPFRALRCYQATGLTWPCFPAGIDFERSRRFDPVVIERRIPGRAIAAFSGQGWAWYELDAIDPARGGSPREEVDAFKLLAVFLAHWDNKAENQRLICPDGSDLPGDGCARPIAMMQDVGATFGPAKLDLHQWKRTPIWADPGSCRVSMEELLWDGGTFPEQHISEGGRLFLLRLLEQLSPAQLDRLFSGARVPLYPAMTVESASAAAWTSAFLDKVRQIREAGPCPALQPQDTAASGSGSPRHRPSAPRG